MTDLPQRHIVITSDGSVTLYVPQWDEHYHSIHGAIRESEHVFINAGLAWVAQRIPSVSILEIGFGTGLNAWLTASWAEKNNVKVSYTALEAFPLTPSEYSMLRYSSSEADHLSFIQLHQAPWHQWNEIHSSFSLRKLQMLLEKWNPDDSYDLIYFDAFAPSAQPELWTQEVFEKLFNCTNRGGVLVTYCAKGAVRRAMKAAGWQVNKLPGPPHKREMTRALKT